MTTAELGGPILQAVSRSFYLSIRLLPAPLREPIGLAYLLARASDTIADSAAASAAVRLGHLQAFGRMIQGGGRGGLPELQAELRAGCPPQEQALLAHLAACLEWLERLPSPLQAEVRTVLEQIVHGQRLDLERFADAAEGSPVALATAAELEEYTYLVAGCVGEFWSRVCLLLIPAYSTLESAALIALGKDFGKGLQLVNILRDLPADLRQGRCYLPANELQAAGSLSSRLLTQPVEGRPVFAKWLARARELLGQGGAYVRAVRPARVRIGCYLPWSLGEQTLDLLAAEPPLESARRVKVTRGAVYRTLVRACLSSFS